MTPIAVANLVSQWLVACSCAVASVALAQTFSGLTVEQAIVSLQGRGLSIVYSTDLVKPWMRIATDPSVAEPVAQLDAILAPFGLRARRHASGVYIVTRAQTLPRPPTPVVTSAGRAPATPTEVLEEIEVVAHPYRLTRDLTGSPVTLLASEIEAIPEFGGDALRAVGRLPGTAAGGFSAQTHLRGGDVDEVSVRFDGLPLHNPYHLRDYQGVFSSIDARLVSTASVYTGSLPAQYGDRMSGVIDIAPIAPVAGGQRELAVSTFNTSLLAAGDLQTRNASWLVTARRTNVDLWYPSVNNEGGLPIYGDGLARLAFDLTSSTRLTLSSFYFVDDLILLAESGDEQTETVFIDRYHWARFDHRRSENLSGVTLVSEAQLASHRVGLVQQAGVSQGQVDDLRNFRFNALQTDWTWHTGGNWQVSFGGHVQRSRGHYDYQAQANYQLQFRLASANGEQLYNTTGWSRAAKTDVTGDRAGAYVSARVEVAPRFTVDLGLRADHSRLESARYFDLSPRLGLRYRLNAATDLRMSWGRSVQAQQADELPVEDGTSLFFRPQSTDQLTLGWEHRLASSIELRAELYDKRIRDPRPRYENLLNTLTLAPELKPDRLRIAPVAASARGIELSVRQTAPNRPFWWLSYTYAKALDQFAGYQAPRSWDQRHTLSAGISIEHEAWTVGATLLARSGWPTTRVRADLSEPTARVQAELRNAANLANFVSFDLRLARRFEFARGSLSTFAELTNAFDRSNPCCVAFDIDEAIGGVDLETRTFLPRFPSLGVVWKF